VTYESKQKWFWSLRQNASEEMTPPSYRDLLALFDELEKAWAALEFYAAGKHVEYDLPLKQLGKGDWVGFEDCYIEHGKRAREALGTK